MIDPWAGEQKSRICVQIKIKYLKGCDEFTMDSGRSAKMNKV